MLDIDIELLAAELVDPWMAGAVCVAGCVLVVVSFGRLEEAGNTRVSTICLQTAVPSLAAALCTTCWVVGTELLVTLLVRAGSARRTGLGGNEVKT